MLQPLRACSRPTPERSLLLYELAFQKFPQPGPGPRTGSWRGNQVLCVLAAATAGQAGGPSFPTMVPLPPIPSLLWGPRPLGSCGKEDGEMKGQREGRNNSSRAPSVAACTAGGGKRGAPSTQDRQLGGQGADTKTLQEVKKQRGGKREGLAGWEVGKEEEILSGHTEPQRGAEGQTKAGPWHCPPHPQGACPQPGAPASWATTGHAAWPLPLRVPPSQLLFFSSQSSRALF